MYQLFGRMAGFPVCVAQEKAPPRTGPDSSLQLRFGVRKDRFPSVCQDNSGCEESFPRLTVKRLPIDKAPFQPAPRRRKGSRVRAFRSTRTSRSRAQRPHCVAGHVGLELRNVVANYPFESPTDLRGIQAEFWPQRLFAFELRRRHDVSSFSPISLLR
jgi:hypothetical protein